MWKLSERRLKNGTLLCKFTTKKKKISRGAFAFAYFWRFQNIKVMGYFSFRLSNHSSFAWEKRV